MSLLLTCGFAQQQQFDLVKYTTPKGWKKEVTESTLQWTKEDAATGGYCIILIMKAIPASSAAKENFDLAWETVVKEMVKVSTAPEMQPVVSEDGWELQSGYAPFENEGQKGIALLATSTGYSNMVNILLLTNTDAYQKEMEAFLASVDITKPADAANNGQVAPKTQQAVLKDGFTFTTSHFDDGWNSVVKADWVEVTRLDMKVYLWYALTYDASAFSGTGVRARDYYWDNYVTKYFDVQTKQYRDEGQSIGSLQPDYVEGWARDKQTGEKRFIAMRLGIAPNTAYITIASAKDPGMLLEYFPKANSAYTSDLSDMSRYNRFAVSAGDILGKWEEGNSNTMQWYYAHPAGNNSYAGMTVAARSAVFNFDKGGNYSSIHNGATGAVGNMSTFQQNYKGKYTVSGWDISATNRWQGQTEKFEAWFVVVRGGRVLKLKSTSIEYNLVKSK